MQAAQSGSPKEEKKPRGKKLHKEPETVLPEPPVQKHRDPDLDPKCRERVAERDGHPSRESARGERDREKPRERRRDARDWDREKLRDKSREQAADKLQIRGKDMEKDGDRRACKEQPRAGAHRDLLGGAGQGRSRRAGACPCRAYACTAVSQGLHVPLARLRGPLPHLSSLLLFMPALALHLVKTPVVMCAFYSCLILIFLKLISVTVRSNNFVEPCC